MKNKHGILVALLILAAICVSLWLLSGRQPNAPATDKAKVIAEHDTVQAHGVDYRHVVDSLSIDNYRLDSSNKSLKRGQATTRHQLDEKAGQVNSLIAQLIEEHAKDKGAALDSLQQQAQNLTFLITQYEQYADSINNVNDSLKINYDAIMKEKDKRIAELQAAYDNLFKAYQQLFADNVKAGRTIKRERLKTKIAALLALVAGGAAVLK